MPVKLSTHVLDLTRGAPAVGMEIDLWQLDTNNPKQLKVVTANADGRTDAPLRADELAADDYQSSSKPRRISPSKGSSRRSSSTPPSSFASRIWPRGVTCRCPSGHSTYRES